MTSRLWAAGVAIGLLIAVVVVVALRVPWTVPPAPRADQLDALHTLPADAVARGQDFRAALRPGKYGSLGIGLLVALVLGLTPLGARLVELAGRPFGGHWLARALIGGLAVIFIGELVTLPFAAWQQSIQRRYGLSTQGWGGWAVDVLKEYALVAVIGALLLGGFFTLTHFVPRWWWAWAAPGAAALVALASFVFPVLVEPVFNAFRPMEQGQLRSDLIAMAERDGAPVRDVLVADASRRTNAANAYVSGLGPTRRIVVYDTLLKDASADEVKAVVAHELGHATHRDGVTNTIIGALFAALGVCVLYLLSAWTPLLRRAGVDSIAEPRAVALLMALATVGGLLLGPVGALLSRQVEWRADVHALELTQDPGACEAMQGRLALSNLGDVDPNRLEYLLFATHPSALERMAAARAWARAHPEAVR